MSDTPPDVASLLAQLNELSFGNSVMAEVAERAAAALAWMARETAHQSRCAQEWFDRHLAAQSRIMDLEVALGPFADAYDKAVISGYRPVEFVGADDFERARQAFATSETKGLEQQ